MKQAFLFTLLLLAIGGAACKKGVKTGNPPVTGEYMIIGNRDAFTATPRDVFYLINNGELRQDTSVANNAVPDNINDFHFNVVLLAASYDRVKDLPSSVPSELLSRNNEHIGTLFEDAGYLDVRTKINGVAYRWYFEGDQSGSSAAVRQFVQNAKKVYL